LLACCLVPGDSYCQAGNTVAGDSNLGAVTLMGDGQSIQDSTNCPGVVGMRDLTNLWATLEAGKSYTLSFQATTCDAGWARLAYAYIDFDKNNIYDEYELLGQQAIDNKLQPESVVFNFVVPSSASGNTRMRVFVVESGFVPNPCLSFSYGVVKEFSIAMKVQSPTPAGSPTPAPRSCCLPTTFQSTAAVLEGSQRATVWTWQDWSKQAYLERNEVRGKSGFSALLCLASTELCYSYTESSCQKYAFVFPPDECPGSNRSKFVFDSAAPLVPGVQHSVYTQTGITMTTVPLGQWCVVASWLPDTVYTQWDLTPPSPDVFAVPPQCKTLDTVSPNGPVFR